MSGAAFNYDFGQKRHWRRWVWNRIREKTATPGDALVIYLAGACDVDADHAIERGFKRNNLIAVERDKRTVDILRGKGVSDLCVAGRERWGYLTKEFFKWSRPTFSTYMSLSGQVFDSVVFDGLGKALSVSHEWSKGDTERYRLAGLQHMSKNPTSVMKAKRSAAAAFAHRTMRATV